MSRVKLSEQFGMLSVFACRHVTQFITFVRQSRNDTDTRDTQGERELDDRPGLEESLLGDQHFDVRLLLPLL